MRSSLILTAILVAATASQAGLVQDEVYETCAMVDDDAAMQYCTLQHDGEPDALGDASDTCSGAFSTSSIDVGNSLEGVLLPLEDRQDWYDGSVASTTGVGVRLVPSGLTSSLVDLRLELKEVNCVSDSSGGGTAPGSRVSDLAYDMPGATAGTAVRIGVVSNGATLDLGSISIIVPVMCDPICDAKKTAMSTLLTPMEYVVQYVSI